MMPIEITAENVGSRTTLGPLARRTFPVLLAGGGAAVLGAFAMGWLRGDGLRYFLHSYLANYCFWLSLSLGASFVVAMLHAARAGWAVTVRRVLEILAANLGVLAILFLPVLAAVVLGNHSLYEWNDPARIGRDEVLQGKSGYLNAPLFALRTVVYFAAWWLIARFYLRRSREQDLSGDPGLTLRMQRFSGPALLILAGTVTFAAIDWLMSLDPHWSSTIYGVYFFSGAVVGGLAAVILAAVALQASGRLTESVTVEHYHDLGKLLLSFVIFWGYIAFSQYLLIWYGNLPEETDWYLVRQTGPWVLVSLGLLFGHLLIPFFGLLPREVKRRPRRLAFWAAWLLVMHWIDVYWLVMPQVDAERLPLGAIDLCLALGLGCLWLAGLVRVAGDRPLVPLRDPRLPESLAFENT